MSNLNKRFWLGLILIILIYSLYNVYLVDVGYYLLIPRKLRHVGKLLVILSVYGTGTWALRPCFTRWMLYLWHFLHLAGISVLLAIGACDWLFGAVSAPVRNIAATLLELLISQLI